MRAGTRAAAFLSGEHRLRQASGSGAKAATAVGQSAPLAQARVAGYDRVAQS
jgi:hypothetical protein